jgi:delta(3,5)-delta(2,4)-dienoyl-CoA isomerase
MPLDPPLQTAAPKSYKHYLVSHPVPYVAHVEINRPQKLNAFHEAMWIEFKTVIDVLSFDPDTRAIVVSGAGDRAFTAGLDVHAAAEKGIIKVAQETAADGARAAVLIKRHVEEFQDCIAAVEKCEKRTLPHFPLC